MQIGNFAQRAIAGQDDLLLVFVKRVEGMEKFFLRAFLAGQEMNVVNQQQINVAIFPAERDDLPLLESLNEFVGECFARDIANRSLAALEDGLTHRLNQVGFAQPVASVNE